MKKTTKTVSKEPISSKNSKENSTRADGAQQTCQICLRTVDFASSIHSPPDLHWVPQRGNAPTNVPPTADENENHPQGGIGASGASATSGPQGEMGQPGTSGEISGMVGLACSHKFCSECWQLHVASKLRLSISYGCSLFLIFYLTRILKISVFVRYFWRLFFDRANVR